VHIKNIVIITYNWPPRNAIGTHRPYSWAKYWSKLGINVTVLTSEKQSFDAPLDLNLPDIPNVKVISVNYKSSIKKFEYFFNFTYLRNVSRKIKFFIFKKFNLDFNVRKNWLIKAKPYAQKLALEADAVISTFGPEESHLLAYEMKNNNKNLLWVADYRDFWSNPYVSIKKNFAKKIEIETVGSHADIVTTVSNCLVREISLMFDKEVYKVTNGFDLSNTEVQKRLVKKPRLISGPLRIVHIGTIYEQNDSLPLLNALVSLTKEKDIADYLVTVDFYGERVGLIEKIKKDSKYSRFIRLMGHINYKQSILEQQNAGVLLILENAEANDKGNLTGKIFEYLVSGRPILSIGSSSESELGKIIKETGTGFAIGPNEYDKIAPLIKETIKGRGLYDIYCPKINNIIKYSRKNGAIEILSHMKKKLNLL